KMIEENMLDAVIGLPANLFQSTAIAVVVLVFDRRREVGGPLQHRKDILFIDGSRDFQAAKTQNLLLEEHINKIVDTYRHRSATERYSHSASLSEIEANDYNLNIPRYVDTFEAEEVIDLKAVQSEIDSLELELTKVKALMKSHLGKLAANG